MADSDPVSSANFYSLCEQSDTSSLAYCTAGIPSVQTSSTSGASGPYMPAIATSPDLDALDVPPYRPRSHSAPSILYQQVALQLRGISDEFNREYSRNQADVPVERPQQGRRRSLPEIHRHEQPQSPNWLHRMIQSLRRASNTPSRSHNSSISRVPEEEDSDTDDDDERPET